jgi:hypothetical protein
LGGTRRKVTGFRGVRIVGTRDVDGIRIAGLRTEGLRRRVVDGLRLIWGLRRIGELGREGVLIRGRLIDRCGVETRGTEREGLLMLGRLTEGRGLDMRGVDLRDGVDGRLGADLVGRLADRRAAELRREAWPCEQGASAKTSATAKAVTATPKRVFLAEVYIVESPFPGESLPGYSELPFPVTARGQGFRSTEPHGR